MTVWKSLSRGRAASIFVFCPSRSSADRHERNPTRRFEVGKMVTRKLDDFGFRGGFAGTEHDKRVRRFSPFGMRHAYDRNLLHRIVAKQHALDFHR